MGERRIINGAIYEKTANGQIVLVGPAQEAPTMPSSIPLAVNPARAAKEARDAAREDKRDARADRSAASDDIRTGIAVRGEQRDIDNRDFSRATSIADKYNADPAVKAYRVSVAQLAQALNTGEGPQADLALTYAFAKAMDPDSVVRESEQGMVADSQPWFQATVEKAKKQFGMDGAGSFTPEARDALRKQIINSVSQRAKVYNSRRDYFSKQAEAFGVDPALVVAQHDAEPFLPVLRAFDERMKPKPPQNGPLDTTDGPPEGEVLLGYRNDGSNRYPVYGAPGTQLGDGYEQSYAGQVVSGINEGIANLAGSPVDLTTAAMNLVPRGINAVADTNIPTIQNPVAGSDWWKDKMADWAIFDQTNDPGKQFARRVGESVGSAAVPLGAAATTVPRFLTQLGISGAGGAGAATAEQAFPGNPYAEMAGEVLGSSLAGYGVLRGAQKVAQREIESAIPTVEDLKEQAGEMYRAAEARGVTAEAEKTLELSEILRNTLREEGNVSPTGRVSEVYPKAKEALQLADDYAGRQMTPTQLQTVRKVITDTGRSPDKTERRLGTLLTQAFDDWAAPIAPELPAARDVASRYLNAETLEQARELAGARASQFTGSGFENALRTEYRGLDRDIVKGRSQFPPEVSSAIAAVSRGTPSSNFYRAIGRFAPTGPVSAAASMGVPAAVGSAALGPFGAGVGLATGGLGLLGRNAATKAGIRNADVAELIARNGGPIEQAPLVPDAFADLAAKLAALQQAKYLTERPQQEGR